MVNERKALVFGLLAVLLWSTVATAFKIALSYLSVLQLLTGASITSLITLSVFLAIRNQLRAAISSFSKRWRWSLLLGGINPVIYYLVLFEAYSRLPAQVAQPVNYTWAITLTLLSVPILKQRLYKKDFAGLLLGYCGVVVISLAGANITGSLDLFGLFLALFSTLLWALFWLLNSKQSTDPIIGLFHNFLVATPVLMLLSIVFAGPVEWSWMAFGSLVYVGLFEMGITFIFWQLALYYTNHTAKIGTLIFLSPFISLFLIHLVLGEPLQWLTFAGLALIIGGVWLTQKR